MLVEELNSLAGRDDAQASFSGTLPYHYYVSHDGIVLASVMIITNQRPSVFVSDKEVQIHNGQIFLEMPYLPGKGNSGELPLYCKIILNLMRDNIPERISELEEMTGESMEFRLGIR